MLRRWLWEPAEFRYASRDFSTGSWTGHSSNPRWPFQGEDPVQRQRLRRLLNNSISRRHSFSFIAHVLLPSTLNVSHPQTFSSKRSARRLRCIRVSVTKSPRTNNGSGLGLQLVANLEMSKHRTRSGTEDPLLDGKPLVQRHGQDRRMLWPCRCLCHGRSCIHLAREPIAPSTHVLIDNASAACSLPCAPLCFLDCLSNAHRKQTSDIPPPAGLLWLGVLLGTRQLISVHWAAQIKGRRRGRKGTQASTADQTSDIRWLAVDHVGNSTDSIGPSPQRMWLRACWTSSASFPALDCMLVQILMATLSVHVRAELVTPPCNRRQCNHVGGASLSTVGLIQLCTS